MSSGKGTFVGHFLDTLDLLDNAFKAERKTNNRVNNPFIISVLGL